MTTALRNAGFWRRAAAFGVDALWLFSLTGVIAIALTGQPWPAFQDVGSFATLAALIRELLPAVVCIVGWGRFGRTPGKLLLDLRVVNARTGESPGYLRALVRYIGYFLSALPLGLGFLWIVFDRQRQGLHDKIAGTRVVMVDDSEILDIEPASVV